MKTKVMCIILTVVLASAGTVAFALNLSGENGAPVLPNNAVDTVMDKPEGQLPSDRTAIENLYIAQGELQRKGGFVGTTTGTAVSAGISQDVYNNRVVIGNSVFKEMVTMGMVKNAYQLYITDNNFLYRKYDKIKSADNITWANTASRYSEEDFYDKFGHRSNKLTGYILNDETIVSGELEKEENGLYTYRYVLDINTAPANMLREMKTNSNMSGYGTFIKAEIIVTMDSDWQVKTLSTDCKYEVPMLGGINCVENCTETFSDLTTDTLPETEFFSQYFNADIERPVEPETSALDVLMDIFAPYASGNNLNVSLKAALNGETVLNGMLSAKIDIENIANIEVAARLGDDLYIEYQQGSLYVTYQDFKASTSVDGIMGVVSALMPSNGDDGDTQTDDILSKLTYKVENDLCTVSLPLTVGDDELNVNIYANVVDDKYEFRNAEVTLGGLRLAIEPISGFTVPARQGDYPEILGLLDIVSNGVIYGNVNAFGMDIDVMFDIATTSLYATNDDFAITYKNNTVYAELGAIKAKIAVDDIEAIVSLLRIAGVIEDASAIELPQISVAELLATLGNVKATATDSGVAFTLSTDGLTVAIYLTTTDKGWNLDKLTVDIAGNVITVALTAPALTEIPAVKEDDYVDVFELVSNFLEPIVSVTRFDGYSVTLNGSFAFDNHVYYVTADVNYNNGLYVNANVTYNGNNMLDVELWYVDDTLYAQIGGMKLAINLANGVAAQSDDGKALDLSAFKGYNPYLDGILDVIQGAIDKLASNDVDFLRLIGGFDYQDGIISLIINGEQLGLSQATLSVSADDGIAVVLRNLVIGSLTANLNASVKESNSVVTAPQGDFTTDLRIKIDDVNTLYANLDLINNVYNFKLDDMYIRYSDGVIKVNKNDIYVSADFERIVALVKRIDDLVNEFSGADESTATNLIDLSGFQNVDVKAIVNSLSIATVGNGVALGADLFGYNVNVNLAYGAISNVSVYVGLINKTIEVSPCDKQAYVEFGDNVNYIAIDKVLEDYFPVIEKLVHTNSWVFNFDGDAVLSIGADAYKVAAGSYFEFYYKNTEGLDTFKLRARLDVHKQRADGTWQPFMNLDIVYKDGTIYITDKGRLVDGKNEADRNTIKIKVDVSTLIRCYDLYDEIVAVVPQIGELVDSMMAAMDEAEKNAESISYSTLLTDARYVDGVFGLTLNAQALLSKLDSISLSAQTYGEGLSLNSLVFTYDTISLNLSNLRVYASESTEVNGEKQYAAVDDINTYDVDAYHMDFNSLYELLSSFVETATPLEDNNGARTFYLSGDIKVDLSFISGLSLITLDLAARVDITADNITYFAIKISHGNNRIAFNDYGADSYLYFDGSIQTISVIRNSKDGLFSSKKISYNKSDMSLSEFSSDMLTNIFEMVHFAGWVQDIIEDSINKEQEPTDYGIEDVFKDYSYTQSSKTYTISADLSPINKNLGNVNLNILHGNDYKLTSLNGNISLVSIIQANLDLKLEECKYGDAMKIVQNKDLW